MDTAQKKQLVKDFKERQAVAFEQSLPMPRERFGELFNYLDEALGTGECGDDMRLTEAFLQKKQISRPEKVLAWLEEQGGYCDCEVLANVEERFE